MYSPPSGKIKINRATKAIQEFMSECFIKNEYSTKGKCYQILQNGTVGFALIKMIKNFVD